MALSNHPNYEKNKRGLFSCLHAYLYYIGARIIRSVRRIKRRFIHWGRKLRWKVRLWLSDREEQRRLFPKKTILQRLCAPFTETSRNLRRRKEQKAAGAARPLGLRQAVAPVGQVLSQLLHLLMPIAAFVFLLGTVNHYAAFTYALRVEYNGQYVGYIENESDFAAAEAQVRNRIIGEEYQQPQDAMPQYTFDSIQPDQLTPPDLLVNNMIAASGNEIQEASGLYVDGKFVGAAEDGDALLMDLNSLKNEDRIQAPDAAVSFVQSIKLAKGLYPVSSVIGPGKIMEKLQEEQGSTVTYTVQPGDSPYELARRFDIPLQNIYDLNPGLTQRMMVGDELLIQKPAPFLQKKRVKTETEQQVIYYSVETEVDQNKDASYQEVVQQGKNGRKTIYSEITYIDGCETDRRVVGETILAEAVDKKIIVGSLSTFGESGQATNIVRKAANQNNPSGYIWPVDGGYITCSIYGYSGHTGNDIAADAGTAIWAAKDGTVAFAGWSRGYGYNVLINHADGTKTRYAHCSALLVSGGEQVRQGEQIALVGRTGNATCNHCHFEIIQNGRFLDSREYV